MTSARFPPIPPSALSEEQKPAHDEADEFARHMGPFTQKDPNNGALIGPFSVLLCVVPVSCGCSSPLALRG